jgi:hypothetical protein
VGVVSAVGPDWVELAAGWEGGTVFDENRLDKVNSRRISAAGTLPAGDPKGPGWSSWTPTHLLTELKVGDRVHVRVGAFRDGREWALEVHIIRRSGGKIPPMHGEAFPEFREPTRHLEYQAYQDWEEKGIPIPWKYRLHPEGRAPWTNPPYPPVAPLPRPAPAKP